MLMPTCAHVERLDRAARSITRALSKEQHSMEGEKKTKQNNIGTNIDALAASVVGRRHQTKELKCARW